MTLRRSPSSILAYFGVATLVAGTIAGIEPGCLTHPDKCTIILSRNTPGGTLGFLGAPATPRIATDSTVFTIDSTNALETSSVNWVAIPKNVGLAASTTFTNNGSLKRSPSGLNVITGVARLVAGTKTVGGLSFGPNAKVFVMATDFGGTSGKLSAPVASVNSATGSFVINSNQAGDTSDVGYVVIDQPLRFSPSGEIMSQSKGSLAAGSAEFSRMDPLDTIPAPGRSSSNTPLVTLASVITPSTPGNLSAPQGVARTDGSVLILSSVGGDISLVEVACF
jgi:hypothetical protein